MLRRLLDAWRSVAPRFDSDDFLIIYRPNQPIFVRGRIPKAKIPGIAGFFAHDLNPNYPVTIRGVNKRGAISLRFNGWVVPADQQRTRNFLLEHLS
jgi:hypothetical protein